MTGFKLTSTEALPSPAVITCKGCSSTIHIRAYLQTKYIACGSCRKLYTLTSTDHWSTLTSFKKTTTSPYLPLGKKGKLKGVVYEVIGYIQWKEVGPDYYWNEYILFNPVYGYAFLNEYNGHWNFIVPTNTYPKVSDRSMEFDFDSHYYHLFLKYRASPVFAVGEFAWSITDTRTVVEEFIAPPHLLVKQKKTDSISWFQGEYTEPEQIREAFSIKAPAPEKIGIGAAQPMPFATDISSLKIFSIVAVLLLTIIHFFISFNIKEEEVFQNTYQAPAYRDPTPVVTPQFTIKEGLFSTSNMEFYLFAPLNDDWLEAEVTLINDDTGEEYQIEIGTEFYDGYDGGEYWSEGSQSSTRFLSAIPAGNYHLNIFPLKGSLSQEYNYTLKLTRNVPMWSNFFIMLLIIGLYPAIQWWRADNFEKQRWINSEYTI